MCMFICTVCVWVRSRQLVCGCVCVSERRLLALLIIHRWVFTIGKGELDRKWWTPCVVDERSRRHSGHGSVHRHVVMEEREMKLISWSHGHSPAAPMAEWPCPHVRVCSHRVCVCDWVCLDVCGGLTGPRGPSVTAERPNAARLQESGLTQPAEHGWHSKAAAPFCSFLLVWLPSSPLGKAQQRWRREWRGEVLRAIAAYRESCIQVCSCIH